MAKLAADGDSLEVSLRGKPGEEVALLFAVSSAAAEHAAGSNTTGYTCHAINTTIDNDGTGAVNFHG